MDHEEGCRIPFAGLRQGQHHFYFQVDDAFFDRHEESLIAGGETGIEVEANKLTEDQVVLMIRYQGYIKLNCDRCLNPCRYEINTDQRLILKVNAPEAAQSDDIIEVSPDLREFLLDPWLMETLNLQRPIRVSCQDAPEPQECDPEVLRRLGQAQEEPESEQTPIDPRWEALKKLQNPNNN